MASEIPTTTATRPSDDYVLWLLDLDGTVRFGHDELGRFVNTPEDVHLFGQVVPLLQRHRGEGGTSMGITNQGGVALGYMTHETSAAIVEATVDAIDPNRGLMMGVLICEHDPKGDCWCRKPNPAMLVQAAIYVGTRGFAPERSKTLMIGDRPEDAQAAERAGIDFRLAREWRAGE